VAGVCGDRDGRYIKGLSFEDFTPYESLYLSPALAERTGKVDTSHLTQHAQQTTLFDVDERRSQDYMLLCGSCNRAKSWSCERCPNWHDVKPSVCECCYWAHPESCNHVATEDIRRLDLAWAGAEVSDYERLKAQAAKAKAPMPQFVCEVLKGAVGR
jgi:hypothetical protein